jgi:hypothetical protein
MSIYKEWSRAPMRRLAEVAGRLARPEMVRRTYWRLLLGTDRWSVLLLTRGQLGEPPEPQGPGSIRFHVAWLETLGENLSGEDQAFVRIRRAFEARTQSHDAPIHPGMAAAIATDVVMELVREGHDFTRPRA